MQTRACASTTEPLPVWIGANKRLCQSTFERTRHPISTSIRLPLQTCTAPSIIKYFCPILDQFLIPSTLEYGMEDHTLSIAYPRARQNHDSISSATSLAWGHRASRMDPLRRASVACHLSSYSAFGHNSNCPVRRQISLYAVLSGDLEHPL